MNFELSEDQRALQETGRDFAANELAPGAAEWEEKSVFPVDSIRRAGEFGFYGLYSQERCFGDFAEGIRALIIDKDRNPRWRPASPADVSDTHIQSFIRPAHPLTDLI